MRTHRERLLNKLPTVATGLCGIAGVHSNHPMSGLLSFGTEDSKELTPTGITNRFGKMVVLDHVIDSQVFHGYPMIGLSILLGRFEVECCLQFASEGTIISLDRQVKA